MTLKEITEAKESFLNLEGMGLWKTRGGYFVQIFGFNEPGQQYYGTLLQEDGCPLMTRSWDIHGNDVNGRRNLDLQHRVSLNDPLPFSI